MSYGQSTLGEFRGIGQALPGDTRPLPGAEADKLGYQVDNRPALLVNAAATTSAIVMTNATAKNIVNTGTGAVTITLPITVALGTQYNIINAGASTVTVQIAAGPTTIYSMLTHTAAIFTYASTGAGTATWIYSSVGACSTTA